MVWLFNGRLVSCWAASSNFSNFGELRRGWKMHRDDISILEKK